MTAGMKNKRGFGMGMSAEFAEKVFLWANWFLVGALAVGVIATYLVIASGKTKEAYLKWGIAEAGQRAAEAEARAAEADHARIKLEARIAPRRLDSASQETFVSSLQAFSGRFVRIESYALDAEGEILSTQIKEALAAVLDIEDWIGAERASGNFTKGINVSGDDDGLVNALASALRDVGLTSVSTEPLPPPTESTLLLEESRSKSPDVAATLLVGVKPIVQ